MLAKTLLTLVLTTNIVADYTLADRTLQPDDIVEAGRKYGEIERRIRTEAFTAIQAEIETQRAEIEAPFKARMEEVDARVSPLRELMRCVQKDHDIFRNEHRQKLREIDTEQEQALRECDERFNAEIAIRLAPVQQELDELSRAEQRLNKTYYDFIAKCPRAYDEIDAQDWGLKLTGIERRRKELINGNCGSLFEEKDAARKAIEARFEDLRAEHRKAGESRNEEFTKEIARLQTTLEPMERENSDLYADMHTEVSRVFAERGVEKDLISRLAADTTALLPNFFEELIRRDGVAAVATN